MSSSFLCRVCGKEERKLKRCARCHQVYYCSIHCQAEDWAEHKMSCIPSVPKQQQYPQKAENPNDTLPGTSRQVNPTAGTESNSTGPAGSRSRPTTDEVQPTGSGSVWRSDEVQPTGSGSVWRSDEVQPTGSGSIWRSDEVQPTGSGSVWRSDEVQPTGSGSVWRSDEVQPTGSGSIWRSDEVQPTGSRSKQQSEEYQPTTEQSIWSSAEAPFNNEKQDVRKAATLYTYANKNRDTRSLPDKRTFQSKIDFQGAANQLELKNKAKSGQNSEINNVKENKKRTYLNDNTVCSDLPEINEANVKVKITVKANKQKYRIELQASWTFSEILKFLAHTLQIPLNKLKLIHKGKLLSGDNVEECVRNGGVYQALGERAENEEGLQCDDVDLIMSQLSVDRNQVVRALREKDDVIDAIFHITNKK